MNIKRIIHIGITAEKMEPVKKFYSETLGLPISREELYDKSTDICFLPVGDSFIEIFSDNCETGNGTVAEYIKQRGGEGIHHIAFEVEDIYAAIDELKAKGIPIRDGDPRPGADGKVIAFLQPQNTFDTLIELVGDIAKK